MDRFDGHRDGEAARSCARDLERITTRPWTLMEVCGGQTHAILRFGIDELLPARLTLLHGPGCPACVTPVELIDKAVQLTLRRDLTLCSFEDMLRVPGTGGDLASARARGGEVCVVCSPMEAVELARRERSRQIVFFAVGFEAAASAAAAAVRQARLAGLRNFTILAAHVMVPPAMEALLTNPDCRVQGFLAAGHVCAAAGSAGYEPISERYRVPIVFAGPEPLDLLQGLVACVRQLEEGRAEVEDPCARSVRREGSAQARGVMDEVFKPVPRKWRGIGPIPQSGLGLTQAYRGFDAEERFGRAETFANEPAGCLAGEVLQGLRKPPDCPAFLSRCTPEHPLGAPMATSEGTCAAYHRYRRICKGKSHEAL